MAEKREFCRIAKELVNDEATGILEYKKIIEVAEKTNAHGIIPWLEEARDDERRHESRMATIVATFCKGQFGVR